MYMRVHPKMISGLFFLLKKVNITTFAHWNYSSTLPMIEPPRCSKRYTNCFSIIYMYTRRYELNQKLCTIRCSYVFRYKNVFFSFYLFGNNSLFTTVFNFLQKYPNACPSCTSEKFFRFSSYGSTRQISLYSSNFSFKLLSYLPLTRVRFYCFSLNFITFPYIPQTVVLNFSIDK